MRHHVGMTRLFQPPQPIAVQRSFTTDKPMQFVWEKATYIVERVVQAWEVDTDWWESTGRVWRAYYAVLTTDGLMVVIYQDLLTEEYYVSKLYD